MVYFCGLHASLITVEHPDAHRNKGVARPVCHCHHAIAGSSIFFHTVLRHFDRKRMQWWDVDKHLRVLYGRDTCFRYWRIGNATMSTRLEICVRCDFRQRPCSGPCLCLADPEKKDIIEHARSGSCPKNFFNAPPEPTHIPVHQDQWPRWAKMIARFKKPQDAGVGDTFKRMAGKFGERYKSATKALGIPCNCEQRQKEWNEKYPYVTNKTGVGSDT